MSKKKKKTKVKIKIKIKTIRHLWETVYMCFIFLYDYFISYIDKPTVG